MEKKAYLTPESISDVDWENTPESVKRFLAVILERIEQQEKQLQKTDYYNLRLFLETDPEKELSADWVNNRPEITFQFLAISRYIQGETWTDLSAQTGIPFRNLSVFFHRTLRKLLPYFKRYL